MLPDGALAQAAFIAVNKNEDAYVCYKPYPMARITAITAILSTTPQRRISKRNGAHS